jgi:hypothetical protein
MVKVLSYDRIDGCDNYFGYTTCRASYSGA